MIEWFAWFVHNSVVRPLLPWIPFRWRNRVHNESAAWARSFTGKKKKTQEKK